MKLYKTVCIIVCFSFFVAGLTTKTPFAFFLAVLFGVFARTSEKKGWSVLVRVNSEEQK